MNVRRALAGIGAFLLGFILIIALTKGISGSHIPGFKSVPPNGIYLLGLVLGSLNGLLAIGLVLVYRTNRIVNFAQGELGAFSATLAVELYRRFNFPFWAAVLVGLAAAVASSAFVEFAVIRRFAKAPRLILTVATLGVAQILGFIEIGIPIWFNKDNVALRPQLTSQVGLRFTFGKVVFRGDHVLVLVATPIVIAALIWFMKGTGYGLAARAAADNTDRARLLGVRVKRVSLIVWMLAGFLSAVTAILQVPITGFQIGTALGGFSLLLRALAAAVIGRMENLTITFAAALLISVGQQALFFTTSRSGPDDGMILLVIIVALVLQRRRLGREEGQSSNWQAIQEVRPVPAELRKVREVQIARYGGGLAAVIGLIALPFLLTPANNISITIILIYSIIGISIVMLTGWAGNVSFGHWAIVGVGALIANKLASSANPLDFFLILLAGSGAGALVAVAIGLPALRIRGLFLGVTTLAFALAAANWFFLFDILNSRTPSIQRPVLFGLWELNANERGYYFVCLAAFALALFIGRNLRRARLGRVLIGIRDNEQQAQSLGVNVTKAKLTAFALSGFLAALAGCLYAYEEQNLRADRFLAPQSILIFSMVVIGGMGSMTGAVLGAAYIKLILYLPAQWQLLATGAGLLILLLVFPGGLGQILYSLRDKALRWVANRHGILVPSLVADKRTEDLGDHLKEAPPPLVTEETPPELVGAGENRS